MLTPSRLYGLFQHTAARRRLGHAEVKEHRKQEVSTHSRPKAAGAAIITKPRTMRSFNTQPPEGGWHSQGCPQPLIRCFNTQPPEGGWVGQPEQPSQPTAVSTHSRPKAAGGGFVRQRQMGVVSTHSRPKAAGFIQAQDYGEYEEFQHTAARRRLERYAPRPDFPARFNTQPPEGGWLRSDKALPLPDVSTHSRPKAAGLYKNAHHPQPPVSTHSRPKAAGKGCITSLEAYQFQHTAARRRLGTVEGTNKAQMAFQHTAARRRLDGRVFGERHPVAFQHTAARRRLANLTVWTSSRTQFQHTAARRRLVFLLPKRYEQTAVSTHSRPKAAGQI